MATKTKITRPKGHKRGCQCVICARKARKNHGYENQARTLHARRAKKNSTVMIPGGVRSRSAETELVAHRRRVANAAHAGQYDYLLTEQNPQHFPRTTAGPKGKVRWYILDLFDGRGNLVSSRYRKCARAKCATEAAGLVDRKVGKKMVRKVELSGPYARKPTASTARK